MFFNRAFPYVFGGIFLFVTIFFIVILVSVLSPALRGKMMSGQVKAMKHMVDNSEDELKSMIHTVKSAVDGSENSGTFCKYCGKPIDEDSKYCKHCGERQYWD